MRVILRELLIIPIYFILLIFKNVEAIATNGMSAIKSLDLVNWPLTIGVILFSIILIFYDKLKDKKKVIFSVSFVTLACMLMQGFFPEKEIYRYILLYVVMIYNAFLFSYITKNKFEISIFASNAILLFVLLILGMADILHYAVVIIGVIEAIISICALTLCLKNRKIDKKYELNFNSSSMVIFSIFFVAFILGGINRYVHIWDEYSHWGYDAKAVINYEKLTTCEESMSATRSYPPYVSLWQFFVSKIMGGFSEGNLYTGLALFTLINLMPAFSFIGKKNKFLLPFYTVLIIFGASLFSSGYGYTSLYADYAMAAAFFNCFVMYFLFKDVDTKKMMKMLLLSLSVLLMIRPTGIIAAFVFFVIAMLTDYLKVNDYKFTFKGFFKNAFKVLKKWLLLGLLIVGLYFAWNIYLRICNATIPMYYDAQIIPDTLRTDLAVKLNSYILGRVAYHFLSMFDSVEFLNLTVTKFIILMTLFAFCICYLKNRNNEEKEFKKTIMKLVPYIIGWIVFLLLNVFAMFLKFPVYEAQTLPGLLRYIDIYNVAMFLILIALTFRENFINNKTNFIIASVIMILFCSQLKVLNITYFVSDIGERKDTRDTSYQLQDKFAIVNENTPEDSKVYIIDQQDKDGIMALWYARYYSFPRKINAYQSAISWKIRTDKNVDDLQDWGLTAQDLEDDLYEYQFDYIYFYSSDDQMYERMAYMFENYDEAKKCSLFKINFEGENVKLVAVE